LATATLLGDQVLGDLRLLEVLVVERVERRDVGRRNEAAVRGVDARNRRRKRRPVRFVSLPVTPTNRRRSTGSDQQRALERLQVRHPDVWEQVTLTLVEGGS